MISRKSHAASDADVSVTEIIYYWLPGGTYYIMLYGILNKIT